MIGQNYLKGTLKMTFAKEGREAGLINKPLLPQKKQNMPKLDQSEPLRILEKIIVEGKVRDDHIDMQRNDVIKVLRQDHHGDPTHTIQGQQLRQRNVKNYCKLLNDNEGTKRSIEEMLLEMQDPQTKLEIMKNKNLFPNSKYMPQD